VRRADCSSNKSFDLIQLRTICLALGTTLPAFVAELEERLARRKGKK
jgi:hypothetical protein